MRLKYFFYLLHLFTLLFLITLSSEECFAKYEFSLKDVSPNYSVNILVEECLTGYCHGAGVVSLIDKKSKVQIQQIKSKDLNIFLDKNFQFNSEVMELNQKQSTLIFDDFNFDGKEDLAVSNGNSSQYSGPSYDVYVLSTNAKKFILSKELTELVTKNLGMFKVDHKKKRLITFSKSGCCWHQSVEYEVTPHKGLVEVFVKEEDATGGDDVIVKEKNRVNGKWQIKTKTFKIKDYYKN